MHQKCASYMLIICRNSEDEDGDDSSSHSGEDTELLSDDVSSDDEDEEQQVIRPYAALMQTLAADAPPQAKRRKLDHGEEYLSKDGAARIEDIKADDDVDEVEEEEEGPETATDGMMEDDEEAADATDPFEVHFADPDTNVLSKRLDALQKKQWSLRKLALPNTGKATIGMAGTDGTSESSGLRVIPGPGGLKLKQKLIGCITKQVPSFDALEKNLAPILFDYQDLLYCERTPSNAERLRRLACLHAINHVFK